MITFYPRELGMWRGYFDFTPSATLTPKEKTDHKCFRNRQELIEFLKEFGVRLDDPNHPLTISEHAGPPGTNFTHSVVQWSCVGWIKDDYR